jgi:hypothetical protein
MGESREVKTLEEFPGSIPGVLLPPEVHGVANVAFYGPVREESESLRDVAQPPLLGKRSGNVDPVSKESAGPYGKETSEGPEQSGFSGAGGSEHRDGRPGGKGEAHRAQLESIYSTLHLIDGPSTHGESSPRRHGTQPERSPRRTRRNRTNARSRNKELTAAASDKSPS